MTVLLDTSAFIWMSIDPSRLSTRAASVIADPSNVRLLSAASVFEMAVKIGLGKLTLHAPLELVVQDGLAKGVVDEFPITISHSLMVERLPTHHRDPFDRLLVAQATVAGVPIVTSDPLIAKYGVPLIW
jgi:PIN domain nuclease of toxin-antitoxin system